VWARHILEDENLNQSEAQFLRLLAEKSFILLQQISSGDLSEREGVFKVDMVFNLWFKS